MGDQIRFQLLKARTHFCHKKIKMKTWIALAFLCMVGVAVAQPAVGADDCTICNHLGTLLEDYLSGGKSAAEAKEFVAGLCDSLPVFNEKCKDYASKIVDFIYNNAQPGEICADLKFC